MKKINEHLYSARWAVSKALEGEHRLIDFAQDELMKAQNLRGEVKEEVEDVDRPSREESSFEEPDFEIIDAGVKPRGPYNTGKAGKPIGLVVHFTAGHFAKGHESAVSTMKYLAKMGLGCLVMATDGTIFRDKNQGLHEWDSHAGRSKLGEKAWVSQYLMGMEICNAGRLREYRGEFYPWWAFDDKGRFKGSSPIPKKDVRIITEERDNLKPGAFHKFTKEQEASLVNFVRFCLDTNDAFKVENIVGHDEIAVFRNGSLGRKPDPGGSLSVSMPEFRKIFS